MWEINDVGLYCIVSYRIVSYRIVSYRIVSYLFVSYRIVSYRIVSYRVVSCRVVSCRVVSCRVVSCRVVSCRVVRIVSYRIVLYCIVNSSGRIRQIGFSDCNLNGFDVCSFSATGLPLRVTVPVMAFVCTLYTSLVSILVNDCIAVSHDFV